MRAPLRPVKLGLRSHELAPAIGALSGIRTHTVTGLNRLPPTHWATKAYALEILYLYLYLILMKYYIYI